MRAEPAVETSGLEPSTERVASMLVERRPR